MFVMEKIIYLFVFKGFVKVRLSTKDTRIDLIVYMSYLHYFSPSYYFLLAR